MGNIIRKFFSDIPSFKDILCKSSCCNGNGDRIINYCNCAHNKNSKYPIQAVDCLYCSSNSLGDLCK